MTIADTTVLPQSPGQVAGSRRPLFDLFLISFVILFLELTCIRWFGSTVIFLTFFTNIVLMACFLGMSVGCLAATRRRNYIGLAVPLSALAIVVAWLLFCGYTHFSKLTIDVGDQTSPQLVYFGTEYRPKDPGQFIIPIQVIAAVFFILIAVVFVGLGQVMGRAFDAIDNRVKAYTTNILGSLAGIVVFGAMSWLQTNPHLWFSLCLLVMMYFVRPWRLIHITALVIGLFIVGLTAYGAMERGSVRWSPYYKIRYQPQTGDIDTNNISHQQMLRIKEAGPAYALPHLLNRDARGGEAAFGDVMIIGAGSGNDVSAALQYGAEHVDAVEIDPVIQKIGQEDHPDDPYHSGKNVRSEERVSWHLGDGRRFARRIDRRYDLAIYALVDSLVLHSGYSSLRLESFLFTQEAFGDIKARLKPGGVFCMYNYYRQGWVIGRLVKMARDVFGTEPLVISMPYQQRITADQNQANCITFVMVGVPTADGKPNPTVESIRKQFEEKQRFWLHEKPEWNLNINGFGAVCPVPEDANWREIGTAAVDTTGINLIPSDNWPFLYSYEKSIPGISRWSIAIIAGASLLILLGFAPGSLGTRPSGQMFFLGAGFMLLETKGVVHMALLFGSTWVVNSVVFFAILVMILLANLFVLAFKPQRLWGYYVLLLAALAVNAAVPMHWFLDFGPMMRVVASCAVIFVPVLFAGIIFATAFRDSARPDIDMGWNIAGVILGGLSEYFSVMVGFQYLLLIAIAYYLLATVARPRQGVAL